jgi:uncharacterized protein (DUF427 family)
MRMAAIVGLLDARRSQMRAVWNGAVLAESDDTIMVEGNHYFPPESLRSEFFSPSRTTTRCHWKGTASYSTITVDGQINRDAAFAYRAPSEAASGIKDYVAFWRGVRVEDSDTEAA